MFLKRNLSSLAVEEQVCHTNMLKNVQIAGGYSFLSSNIWEIKWTQAEFSGLIYVVNEHLKHKGTMHNGEEHIQEYFIIMYQVVHREQ